MAGNSLQISFRGQFAGKSGSDVRSGRECNLPTGGRHASQQRWKGRRGSPLRGFRNDECELLVVPQHDASAARCDQLLAEFLKVSAVVVYDADVVTHFVPEADAAAADDDRLAITDQ